MSGYRRPARGLSEQNLLPLFRDRRAAREWFAFRVGPLCTWALAHRIEPAPQVREVVQILLLALPRNDPRIGSHVGDAIGVADDERAVLEVAIQHAVETVRLLDVAFDRVLDFRRRVDPEMVVL